MENTNQTQQPQQQPQRRPNDTNVVGVTATVKIFDPNTQEKFVEQQA